MPTLNLNTSPYFDDYQQQLVDNKDYVRVLFRPGFAVQARELTQLQSIMQEQVTRFGNHIFKDGSIVQNGEVKFINNYDSITIDIPVGNAIVDYTGRVITGVSTGVKARVIDTDNVNRLFVRYLDEGNFPLSDRNVGAVEFDSDQVLDKFIFSDALGADFSEELTVSVADNPGQTEAFGATLTGVSLGSAVSVVAGTYYVDGIFTRIQAQTLILDLNNPRPSFRVGFELQSSVVTSNEDNTLVDNSRGTTNTGAPGANRLENRLLLAKRDLSAAPDEIFIEVVRIESGIVQSILNNPQYADLLTTFARRTFDESGNYALDPFLPDTKDTDSDTSKFNLSLSPSKAYVQGYEIETVVNTNISIDRSRESVRLENHRQPLTVGNYLQITDVPSGMINAIPFSDATGAVDSGVKLYLRNHLDQTLGYAHVRGYDKFNARLYIYDVRPFTRVPVDSLNVFAAGDVIRTTRGITGVVADIENLTSDPGAPGTTDAVYLVNVSGTILDGDVLISQTNNSRNVVSRVDPVVSYIFSNDFTDNVDSENAIQTVSASLISAFRAEIIFTNNVAIQGMQSGLVFDTQREIKAATFGNSKDNDFEVIARTNIGNANTNFLANSAYTSGTTVGNSNLRAFRVDDGDAIAKDMEYETQIHSIRRDADADSGVRNALVRPGDTGTPLVIPKVGYGWAVEDRELSLQFPDIYRVLAIYDSLDPIISPIADRLNLQTGSVVSTFEQGDIVVGSTSGAEATVIRENSNNGNIEISTGSEDNNVLEVLITRGAFIDGEIISSGSTIATLTESNSLTRTTHINITGSYELDDGQRLDYYDLGRLVRKAGAPIPQGQIMVVLSRWGLADGDNNGIADHYYNVDSYPTDDIGFFNTDPRFNTNYFNLANPFSRITGTNLRNSIDFRRRVKPNTIALALPLADQINFADNPFSFQHREFLAQTYVVPSNNAFTFEFDYFLARRDRVVLNKNGEFLSITGIPDNRPRFPTVPEDVMDLNTIDIPPYTRYVEDVTITTANNRRYTMRDIGDIDSRLRNVETAISLTALESNVFNADITDEGGLQRFKSGFITDDFLNTQSGAGDFDNNEFNVAYGDEDGGLMQPGVTEETPWRMREQNPNTAARGTANYTVSGGLATLPYEEVIEISQTYASVCLRINPHAVWIFGGEVTLTPSSVFWDEIVNTVAVITSYQDANGRTVMGPFTINQVPANVRGTISMGRPVRTVGSSTLGRRITSTTSRVIGRGNNRFTSTQVNAQLDRQDFVQDITTQVTTTVRQAVAQDITSSRIVNSRIIRPAEPSEMQKQIIGQNIRFNAIDFKPNTLHTMSFDGVDISGRISGDGSIANRTTDAEGSLAGSFSINILPGDTFLTGSRIFEMNANTSSGAAKFTAAFYESTRQNDIVSTRSVIPAQTRILSQSSTRSTSSQIIRSSFSQRDDGNDNGGDGGDGGDGDPIAQSFFVTDAIFITSLDIRMCFVDPARPNHVELEIRNMVNGYPGTMIIPGGRISRTVAELNGSTFAVNADGSHSTTRVTVAGDVDAASNYTRMTFKSPVFLEGDNDYCFVLKTPSPATSVWTAIRGETDVVTGASIDDQPYLGSSFVSQNNVTWNAEQNRDITFILNRAEFDATNNGTITLENDTTEINQMYNIGANETRPGLAIETNAGSSFITVVHPNHGMYDTAPTVINTVEIIGVEANNNGGIGTFNGIPIAKINAGTSVPPIRHTIIRPTLDTYQILIGDSEVASHTGAGGGAMVQATQNYQYDKLMTGIMTVEPDGTNVNTSMRTTSGTSLWLALVGGAIENVAAVATGSISTTSDVQPGSRLDLDYTDIPAGEDVEFASPRLLTNSLNNGISSSLFIRLQLSVSGDQRQSATSAQQGRGITHISRVSPVIDLASNNGLFGEASIIDNNARSTATGLSTDVTLNSEGLGVVGNGDPSDGTNTITNGATPPVAWLQMNHSHRSITDSEVADLTNRLVDSDPDSVSYLKQGMFSNLERTAYVTKQVNLENEADRITVIFDADIEPGNNIHIWVKTSSVEDDTPLSELDWVELSNIIEFPSSRAPINNMNDDLSSAEDFKEFNFDSGDNAFASFNVFSVRVTIDLQNEAEPPRFRNFRTIATA